MFQYSKLDSYGHPAIKFDKLSNLHRALFPKNGLLFTQFLSLKLFLFSTKIMSSYVWLLIQTYFLPIDKSISHLFTQRDAQPWMHLKIPSSYKHSIFSSACWSNQITKQTYSSFFIHFYCCFSISFIITSSFALKRSAILFSSVFSVQTSPSFLLNYCPFVYTYTVSDHLFKTEVILFNNLMTCLTTTMLRTQY